MSVIKFELKEDHIKLLKHLNWSTHGDGFLISSGDSTEMESPFGGMNIYEDIHLILNGNTTEFDPLDDKVISFTEEEKEEMMVIFEELPTALDIILFNGHFECGKYKTKYHYRDWKKIK